MYLLYNKYLRAVTRNYKKKSLLVKFTPGQSKFE